MFLSLGIILILGFIAGYLLSKIRIPGLIGMIIVGLVIGPYCLDLIDEGILGISSELRQIALVIILTRSGLSLDIESLKKVGRPAVLMCFIPASLEIVGVMLASHYILDLSWFEALLLGSVLGAVSPAVVVPRMISFIDKKMGERHQVPKLILAGSSVDDIYTIVLFYAFLGLVETGSFQISKIALIPATIASGIALGIIIGIILAYLFKRLKTPIIANVIIFFGISLAFLGGEASLKKYFDISAYLAIISSAMVILFMAPNIARDMQKSYNSMWKVFEILLFVLVGAALDFKYSVHNFFPALLVLFIGLAFRMLGVFICMIKTNLTFKERIFAFISYLPKATVQASIGGIALSRGLDCGSIVLTVSVIAIFITAPIGAILIDLLSPKLLPYDKIEVEVVNDELSN